jgi:hypothetical protein
MPCNGIPQRHSAVYFLACNQGILRRDTEQAARAAREVLLNF